MKQTCISALWPDILVDVSAKLVKVYLQRIEIVIAIKWYAVNY